MSMHLYGYTKIVGKSVKGVIDMFKIENYSVNKQRYCFSFNLCVMWECGEICKNVLCIYVTLYQKHIKFSQHAISCKEAIWKLLITYQIRHIVYPLVLIFKIFVYIWNKNSTPKSFHECFSFNIFDVVWYIT